MADTVIIEPYSDDWFEEFLQNAEKIRYHMGKTAVRIDHIGSTSIKGLDAKSIIDILVTVKSFESFANIQKVMEYAGYRNEPDNAGLIKRFREPLGEKRTHIHIVLDGHWSQQLPLLFRDYMRMHPDDCRLYSDLKHKLSIKYCSDRIAYAKGKDSLIWNIMSKANLWAREIGWIAEDTDY